MKLYKYRSLRQNLDFVLDILLNGRLYCAEYQTLNDPLEGFFIEEIGEFVRIWSYPDSVDG